MELNGNNYKEFIRYFIAGCLTTLVSWITYAIFVQWLSIITSNILSWICAVSFAYFINKFWVFENKNLKVKIVLKEILTFFLSRLFSGVIETIGLYLLSFTMFGITIFNINSLLAKIIMSIVSMVLNYILSKIFVFKK